MNDTVWARAGSRATASANRSAAADRASFSEGPVIPAFSDSTRSQARLKSRTPQQPSVKGVVKVPAVAPAPRRLMACEEVTQARPEQALVVRQHHVYRSFGRRFRSKSFSAQAGSLSRDTIEQAVMSGKQCELNAMDSATGHDPRLLSSEPTYRSQPFPPANRTHEACTC